MVRAEGEVLKALVVGLERPRDAIRIAPGVVRALEAGDDGLEYLAFGPHCENDGEIIKEDVWGDA